MTYGESQAAKLVGTADELAARMHAAFDSLIPRVWVERYLAERLDPIRDQAGLIVKKAAQMRATRADFHE